MNASIFTFCSMSFLTNFSWLCIDLRNEGETLGFLGLFFHLFGIDFVIKTDFCVNKFIFESIFVRTFELLWFLVNLRLESVLFLLFLFTNSFRLSCFSIRKILFNSWSLKQSLSIIQIDIQNCIRLSLFLMLFFVSMRHLHISGLIMLIKSNLVKSVMSCTLKNSFCDFSWFFINRRLE